MRVFFSFSMHIFPVRDQRPSFANSEILKLTGYMMTSIFSNFWYGPSLTPGMDGKDDRWQSLCGCGGEYRFAILVTASAVGFFLGATDP